MLTHLEIDDAIVQCFVNNWHPDSNLRYLYLPWNDIGFVGVQMLLQAAQQHLVLRKIELDDNNVGFEGLRLIGNFLPSLQHVTHLQIENCVHLHHFDDFTCEAAHQQEQTRHRAGHTLLNGIKGNVYMKEFSFDENVFPDMCEEIGFYVCRNQLGRYLLTTHHELASTVWCIILSRCNYESRRADYVYFFLREQPHLVQPRLDRHDCIDKNKRSRWNLLWRCKSRRQE
jgi:hypothetical protein